MGAPGKITFVLPVDLSDIPRADRAEAKEAVADYVKEAILEDAAKGVSSVSGKKWAALDPDYKEFKSKKSSAARANLELTGAMLDALEVKIKGNKIEIGWFDEDEAAKADGHNNFSGESKLPLRQSIPKPDEEFRPGIREQIASILADYKAEEE